MLRDVLGLIGWVSAVGVVELSVGFRFKLLCFDCGFARLLWGVLLA